MNVWMTDHDPAASARALCDDHVKRCPFAYAQLLAYAWHSLHNEAYLPLTDDTPRTPWFKFVAPTFPPYSKSEDRPRSPFPGESPYAWWLLFGQRVPGWLWQPDPLWDWVVERGGNYAWLWRLTSEVCVEFAHRAGRRHPVAPFVWPLEVVPFALDATVSDWSEPPPTGVPPHLRVLEDGYYDAVATNRRYYNIFYHSAEWTKREPPAWLQEEHKLTIDGEPQ